MQKTDDEWKRALNPEQYRVLRAKGTEVPFTGAFYKTKDDGMYYCAGCHASLFSSERKFETDCGWPSFDSVVNSDAVRLVEDDSMGMHRTEVVCAVCEGHLGHLFDDGPTQTGKRFCINSASLSFEKKEV